VFYLLAVNFCCLFVDTLETHGLSVHIPLACIITHVNGWIRTAQIPSSLGCLMRCMWQPTTALVLLCQKCTQLRQQW